MLHLIKYELRGKYLSILGICLTVIMGNLFLMTKVSSWEIAVPVLSTFLGGGALILMFLSSLTLMSDYLYNEQGYLLFTLPQSGVSIMLSRLLAAVSQISIVTIVALIMFYLVDQEKIMKVILRHIEVRELLYSVVMYLWTIVSALTVIYFCLVVGKIALKGKKLGKIGSFIIFILLSIGHNGVTFIIANFFPQSVQLDSISTITINIGTTIFDMMAFMVLFWATSYLLENKVEL